jgi:hypothetical protein
VYVSETNRKVQVFYKQGQSEILAGLNLIENIQTSTQTFKSVYNAFFLISGACQ